MIRIQQKIPMIRLTYTEIKGPNLRQGEVIFIWPHSPTLMFLFLSPVRYSLPLVARLYKHLLYV